MSLFAELTTEYLLTQGELLLRILAASVFGALIGYERTSRSKGAGIRTHAIVSLGAALIMVVSKYGFSDLGNHDGARLAAQVVSGIGFLGAGIIFIRNNAVSGLTTAAGIWTTAGIGLCFGTGLYLIGIVSSFMILAIQVVMHSVPVFVRESYRGKLKVRFSEREKGLATFQELAGQYKIEMIEVKIKNEEAGAAQVDIDVIYPYGCDKTEFILKLSGVEGVGMVQG